MFLLMNFQFYFEKLKESTDFKKFMKENRTAFLCSGFFAIDKEKTDNQQHFDFYAPNLNKIFSFQLEKEIKRVALERFDEKVPEKVSSDFDFEFEEIEQMILERMKKEGIKNKLQKILLSLQRVNGKDFITGTAFISGLGMLKLNIDPVQKEIIDFEKKSFFDMMKIVKK